MFIAYLLNLFIASAVFHMFKVSVAFAILV